MKRGASAELVAKRAKRATAVAAAAAAELARMSGVSGAVSASTGLPTGIARLIASQDPGTKFGPLSVEVDGVMDGGDDGVRIEVDSDTTLIQLNRALQRLHGDNHSILLYCQGTARETDADIGLNRVESLEYATVEQIYRPLLNPEGILRLRTWFR
jgi:hypothetical protein